MYRTHYRCKSCNHNYARITKNIPKKDSPCPQCKKANKVKAGNPVNLENQIDLPLTPINNLYKCQGCLKSFAVSREQDNHDKLHCPYCGSLETKFYSTDSKSPISVQGRTQNKAIDATAQIVMEDYKLGDLKDNVRQGETMAPKLPPAQQVIADSMFANKGQGGKQQYAINMMGGPRIPINNRSMGNLGRAAIGGAFRDPTMSPAIQTLHENRMKPKINVINEGKR